jgi:hypothetical protein
MKRLTILTPEQFDEWAASLPEAEEEYLAHVAQKGRGSKRTRQLAQAELDRRAKEREIRALSTDKGKKK